MKNIINLSKLYSTCFFYKKSFSYSLIFLIIISLFIIPNKTSNYVTFYLDKFTGFSNTYWVSSLGAVFTNLILSFVGFFFIEGAYKKEVDEGVGQIIRVTPLSNFALLLHKWLAFIFLFFMITILIIVSLFIINYKDFNFFTFTQPFFYFTLPFIFILSAIILFFDTFIYRRGLKIGLFIFLILFLILPINNKHVDILGFNEFGKTITEKIKLDKNNVQTKSFAIGYIKKTEKLDYIVFQQDFWYKNLFIKILYIPISLLIIYLLSPLYQRYKQKSKKVNKPLKQKNNIHNTFVFNKAITLKPIQTQYSIVNAFLSYFIFFKSSFSLLQTIALVGLWVLSFFVSNNIAINITVPLLFLLSFNIFEKFVNVDNKQTIAFSFTTAIFSRYKMLLVKMALLLALFVTFSMPILFLNNEFNFALLMTMLLFSLVVVMVSEMLGSVKLMEVFYIVIFCSYIAGFPIIKLF